ncbi:hypothetical protein NN3_40290 [Nocardia neocaledoniensis NBRC 108232]|uniref:Uncharacterized protein n=1 Tax=Nocardia neocaledoniensis TaxID=236511 RepID=A0A317NRF2_9NOCA|nr:hypothetical protein [Nocardia neocaledoniensis]PWV77685.1 hypothetical protein DFR69_103284 [Nocardia neocaledoniensis]GEM33022.1 hypothetical protein NN3_40290 [Nocardia neocaledoniensis NBRC 108232]
MRLPRYPRFAAVAVVAAVTVVCGAVGFSATVPGAAVPGEVDVRPFDIGNYPVEPLEFRSAYRHTVENGTELAIMRLAGNVVTGYEVDAGIAFGRGFKPIAKPSDYTTRAAQPDLQGVLERNHLAFGLQVSAGATETADLDPARGAVGFSIAVFQFPDAAAAGAAATEFEAVDFGVTGDNTRIQLAGYPSARSHWRPEVRSLGTRLAHGAYMIDLTAFESVPDLAALTTLTERVLGKQLPLLDSLPPLSHRDIYRLEDDASGLLRVALNETGTRHPRFPRSDRNYVAVLNRRGAIVVQQDQAVKGRMYDEAGVDGVAFLEATVLLRARDAAAARTLQADMTADNTEAITGPDGVPDTVCRQDDRVRQGKYSCTVRYGRYVAKVVSDQVADVRQRAAAQYALLTNS